MRKLFLFSAGLLLLAGCSRSPHVWILGDAEIERSVKFEKPPKKFFHNWDLAYSIPGTAEPYKLGKIPLRFELPGYGDYTLLLQNSGGSEAISFEAEDEYKLVTVIDPTAKNYILLQDVSAMYSDSAMPGEFPVTRISPPAKVHKMEMPRNTTWGSLKLPQYTVVQGKNKSAKVYKLFALRLTAEQVASPKKIESDLTQYTLGIELRAKRSARKKKA